MSWIELVAQRRPQPPPGVTPPENAADWFRIENSADEADTTDVYVYDAVGGWYGMYADDFIRDLRAVSTGSINIRINSPGGSVFDGVAIANAIRSHPANVTCYVDSLAASIASVIALSGDRLVMRPQSMLMIHDASATVHGNAKDMQDTADLLDKTSDNLAGAYAAKAGGTVAEWRDRMRAETWMTAQEAVDLGLADEAMPMLPKKGDDDTECAVPERMRTLWDLSAYRYAGRENAPAPAPAPVAVMAQAPEPPTPPAPEPVILPSPVAGTAQGFDVFAQYTEQMTELVRNAVRVELTAVADEKKLPPWLKPDEDEDDDEEKETDDESEASPEATGSPPTEDQIDTDPGDAEDTADPAETHNEADPWTQVVGFLVPPSTSPPSADDVFAQLKGAW